MRKAIARHPSVSNEILERFREDEDEALKIFAFEQLLKRGEEPISSLYQSGYGTELDVFQISKEQYQLILESKDTDLVEEWDLIDEGAHSYADDIDLYLNDKKITLTNPLVEKLDEQITETGKFYFIRAWENKGTWWECSFKGKFII